MKDKENKEVVQLYGKVFIYYSNKGLVYRHPTKIPWDEKNLPQNKEVIDSLVKKVRDAVSQHQKEHNTNPPRDYIRDLIRGKATTEKKNLMDYYNEFISSKKDQVKTGGLNPNSIGDLNSLKSALGGFEEHSKTKFQISDINEDFIGKFKDYLLTVKNVSENTAQKRINSLKVFVKYFEEKKG